MSSTTSAAPAATTSSADSAGSGVGQSSAGISLVAFLTALGTSLIIFGVQISIFLLLRNKLARIFKPKSYLVPERERTEPPPASPWSLLHNLLRFRDREIIKKCGLDAFFFLRYLQTLLFIFVPIAFVVIPILVPINFVGGKGNSVDTKLTNNKDPNAVTGLDTLAWGNVKPDKLSRRWAHLILALGVILWVCCICFTEMRVYIKVRQDYLTSAEHRLRASANTVLVSSIPDKWLSEEALRGLFDVFPGGIRNIWLTRDFSKLLDKVHKRDAVHKQLEGAQTELIRNAKKKQLKVRAAEEKKARKEHKTRNLTKAEREQRQRDEDAAAQRRAAASGGLSAGDHEDVQQLDDVKDDGFGGVDSTDDLELGKTESRGGLEGGLAKVGHGLKGGVGLFGKAGKGILGGAKQIGGGVDKELERTGGFEYIPDQGPTGPSARPQTRDAERPKKTVHMADDTDPPKVSFASEAGRSSRAPSTSAGSVDFGHPSRTNTDIRNHTNTTRKVDNWDDVLVTEESKWWQFWKPPSGAYASPVPQGLEGDEYPFIDKEVAHEEKKSLWAKIKSAIPFVGGDDEEPPVDYPTAINPDHSDDDKEEGAEWRKWLKESDRPTHRLPLFDFTPSWLPGLPGIHKKVDTIYWCRKELAQLNMEIEEDQQHPERYPIMNSAFIQFNHQVAAHMACQSVTHHIPRQMAPRVVEISPNDVLWDNMAVKWWDAWLRTFISIGVVVGMIILWAFPVAFTSGLSQIDSLIKHYPWLGFLGRNPTVYDVAKAVAGVLPALLLSILLALVPIIFGFLASFAGAKTGSQKTESVQIYYFAFLFVQVFLVVSIASGALTTLQEVAGNIQSIPETLAKNLPKAANYFFSYMILQALSTSSGTLLQVGTLLVWFVVARLFDNTARSKWARQTNLSNITWGSFFPVYTNFACIALIYSVIAPLISIFAIITFSLLWFAHRYNMVYVIRFQNDTGGVLYPRAINQLFTGLYVMELCLIGLFFLDRDQYDHVASAPQGIVMIVAVFLTVLFQLLLNWSFGPLLRYLPITFEDEAVIRDEAFQRAQDRRLGLISDDDDAGEANSLTAANSAVTTDTDIEMRKLNNQGRTGTNRLGKLNPVKGIKQAGTWAVRSGKHVGNATFGKAGGNLKTAAQYRRERRMKDLEAQRKIGEALYGGYHDEIEDLTPEERDQLVKQAFKHYALRARRPTVWIPRDDLGVSDDEIMRTREMSDYIWISNEGTALDSKVRVVYGRAPPDFSDVELINL
ncbi:uncharacterized protein E0L32_008512 [Thyridium curvatum]|uniref:DUF221-domain-containing protein n=1 Tax=Thyridium curvatum TaxID=1093900 RepID=A0A507AL91_9PEZI|nr:uncharacterized protein E0L32_008512 [Thyridium curvatum]TPX10462.1 hypothetical protein E0L32_008512 [Thyridium curvatum]